MVFIILNEPPTQFGAFIGSIVGIPNAGHCAGHVKYLLCAGKPGLETFMGSQSGPQFILKHM